MVITTLNVAIRGRFDRNNSNGSTAKNNLFFAVSFLTRPNEYLGIRARAIIF